MDARHDALETLLGVLEAPRVTTGVLLHLQRRGGHSARVGGLPRPEGDAGVEEHPHRLGGTRHVGPLGDRNHAVLHEERCVVRQQLVLRGAGERQVGRDRPDVPAGQMARGRTSLGVDGESGALEAAAFAARLARRSSVRTPLPLDACSATAIEERAALVSVHEVVGSIMLHHPGAIWGTATLVSMPLRVHPKGHPREGHPTAYSILDQFGQPTRSAEPTHRTPDGAVWFYPEMYPDVLVEFEGDGKKARIAEHIEAALWQSSEAQKHLTLIFATTTRSETSVERTVGEFMTSRQPSLHRADWPGTLLSIRVARLDMLRDECPIHGRTNKEWIITRP